MKAFKSLISLSLLFCLPLWGSDEPMEPELYQWCLQTRDSKVQPFDALISLGGECQVAYQMRLHGLRNEALPFDWIITPFSALLALLEDQFEQFLMPKHLLYFENEKTKYILDTHYGIRFLHDFKLIPNFMPDYPKVKEMYARRIERFLSLIKTSKRALFIRKSITKEQAQQLESTLKKLCPENDFLILAVDNTQEIKTDWQLKRVKNYYLRPPVPAVWKGDPLAWQEIFLLLELQLTFFS